MGPGSGTLLPLGTYVQNFNPAVTFGSLNSLHSKSMCDTDRPLPLVPRNHTKEARTDEATTALGGGGHRTEGHESRDMTHEAYCPGLGSPGHGSTCPSGLLPLEACGVWTQGGHVALEAVPASSSPGGSRSRKGPRLLLVQFLICFE